MLLIRSSTDGASPFRRWGTRGTLFFKSTEAPVTGPPGRPRIFDLALVTLALERRARTGETWKEIARDLRTHPGTLQNRSSECLRIAHKTPTESVPSASQRIVPLLPHTPRPVVLCA